MAKSIKTQRPLPFGYLNLKKQIKVFFDTNQTQQS